TLSTSRLIDKYVYLIRSSSPCGNPKVSYMEAHAIAEAVNAAVEENPDLNGFMILCLIKTESDYDRTAISHKGYSGLMQTPGMSGYIDLDVRWGVRILKKKLELAHYDLKKAVALYKGGNNRLARKQAAEFMRRWRKVSREIDLPPIVVPLPEPYDLRTIRFELPRTKV
ncbi:MAG TPA: lytic transglycosylase domain-containing protein, partial [Candidatus Binatus sp.]|nr:lytic transglycosylase domain-containing protein [Candidatus Binatus sp.]